MRSHLRESRKGETRKRAVREARKAVLELSTTTVSEACTVTGGLLHINKFISFIY